MRNVIRRLWHDDRGAVVSTELVMVLGVVAAGVGSGLAAMRNNLNRQLAAVSALPDAVIPTTADLQRQIAQPPEWTAKTQSRSQSIATAYSVSGATANVYVNVQIPSRSDLPSP